MGNMEFKGIASPDNEKEDVKKKFKFMVIEKIRIEFMHGFETF
jgi:hypothetical protein